jgi:hypothetical protein
MKDLINILNERVGDNAYGSATLTTQGIGGSRFTKTNRPPGIWEAEDLPIVAKRLKDVFDQVGNSEFWKNHFKSKYGIPFPTNLKDINKKQALAMNKFGTHMNKGMNEAGIAFELEPATGGDKKLKIFKNKSEADRFAQQAANIKKATQMEEEKEESLMGEEPSEGNAFGQAMQNAKKGDKVKVGDQEFIKKEMHTNDMGKNNWVDDEGRHAKMQLQKAAEYSIKLTKMMDDMTQLPSWVQSKITKASDYMSAVYHYLDYEMTNSQNSLMENMDKHRKRPKLMEGAMKRFFKAFDGGSTDEELVHEYAREGLTVPEAFVSKARKQWESLKKAKLELELSEKEAKGFRQVQTTDPTDVMGMEPQSEEKHLASGLFK